MILKPKDEDSLIILIWGVHGNEAAVTKWLADYLKQIIINGYGIKNIHTIGPISPWSYRHGFRFDKKFCDPNRVFREENNMKQNNYEEVYELWKNTKPDSVAKIEYFIKECNLNNYSISEAFQLSQTRINDFLGYVDEKRQKRRIEYIMKKIKYRIEKKRPKKINIIDMHAGIGNNNETIIYDTKDKLKNLCNSLKDEIIKAYGINCNSTTIETGVINNKFGLINVLSEVAYRTHGFKEKRIMIDTIITEEWKYKTKNNLCRNYEKMNIFE